MSPLPLLADEKESLDRIESIIHSMPRAEVVSREAKYLRAEFRSPVLGFVDDVEFMIDDSEGHVHFRSASRFGYSDLGVNRKRMEEIRRQYEALNHQT